MSFRLRLTVLTSLAVAVAIIGTSFVVYYTDRSELIRQVDGDLMSSETLPAVNTFVEGPATWLKLGPVGSSVKRLDVGQAGGKIIGGRGGGISIRTTTKQVVLPKSAAAVQVTVLARRAAGRPTAPRFTTQLLKGVPMRVLTLWTPLATVEISRPLADINRNLSHLRFLLVLISAGGIGVAALLGAFVSGRAVAPLRRLTATTDRIVETGDLSERIGGSGRDEISRLSSRLDELLGTLDSSLRAQRQLVADASHELRTPIASLRANFELLAKPGALDPAEREDLLADVHDELESMTTLVAELVELARGEEADVELRDFRLDEVVRTAVERAARRSPALSFETRFEPSTVRGVPERVERAVANLLDNARKWSPAGGKVDVAVHDGVVEVQDSGPGIAPEDVPLIFNRFYRSRAARGMPGAGLGLAIVKQIADAHGGSVAVDRAADGGAILRLQLSPSR